jgi:hypothetical protein
MEQFRPKTTPPLANPERLTGHCEELYELIASLNNILNLYMPAGQEAEHRFPMGELPQEVMEICQRLAKLTETLRGLAELFLNDLSEKTGSHDVVRLHRVLLQMNRALGMFESQSKLWRLASLAQSSGAPVTKWARATCATARCISGSTASGSASAISWKAAVAQRAAYRRDLCDAALAEQLFAPAGDERAERESGRPLCGAGFALQPRRAGQNRHSADAL